MMDTNNDGFVSKQEFCDRASDFNMNIRDFGVIYDSIDLKKSGQLSVHEIALFIKGAKDER